jgi:hypothetical protein
LEGLPKILSEIGEVTTKREGVTTKITEITKVKKGKIEKTNKGKSHFGN